MIPRLFPLILVAALALAARAGEAGTRTDGKSSAPVLLHVPDDPTISFRLWFKVGAQNDPAGKEGLAALTANLLTEGATTRLRYEEILNRLFPLAAGYSAAPATEMTVISGRIHRDNLAEFYPLLVDAVTAPAFAAEDLERLRSRTLNALENTLRYASDEELGKAVLQAETFAGTRYRHPTLGTVAGVKSITLDDIRAFYRQHYTRDNVVVGLGGSFDAALLARLQQDLARLPAGRPMDVPAPQPAPLEGVQVTMIEKQAPATAISLGFPIEVRRGSKDWYALAIANSWLGEHRNSSGQLFRVIRERRGLNYGDYSYIEHFPNGGYRMTPPQNVGRRQQMFEIWIRPVPHEARHFALRAALRELEQLVEHGLTREAFEARREFLKKYVLHYAPTTMQRLGYALDDVYYGIEEGHLERFRRMMDTLTLEDVNAAIRRHWQTKNLRIAVVTSEAASFADALVANTPSPIEYTSPKPDEILAEDKVIARHPLPVRREDIRIIPVAEVFAR